MAAKKKTSKAAKKVAKKKTAPAKKKTAAKKKVAPAAKKKVAKKALKKVAKKVAKAKKKVAAPAKKKKAAKVKTPSSGPTSRRDATGHLNPEYAKKLREASNEFRSDDDDTAFFRKSRSHDTLAEELGEDAVASMTSGEDQSERLQDEQVEEENGGPFITTSPREEFAVGTDASNPDSATREPFPKV